MTFRHLGMSRSGGTRQTAAPAGSAAVRPRSGSCMPCTATGERPGRSVQKVRAPVRLLPHGHGFAGNTHHPRLHVLRSARLKAGATANSGSETAKRLVELVAAPTSGADEEILALIATLEELELPLAASAFQGPWEVVWSQGTMAWRALVATAVQRVAGNCRAGQQFDISSCTALNFAELFDRRCTITARGTFKPVDKPLSGSDVSLGKCPVAFDVSIEEGELAIGSSSYGLPINGPGYFQVLYGDSSVRIFRSSGGLAVQVPSDWAAPSQ